MRIIIVEDRGTTFITQGPWSLEWAYIGEGVCGEYEKDDENDVPQLRATLSYKHFPCAKGSYCTKAPRGTHVSELLEATLELFAKLEEPAEMKDTEDVRFNHHVMQDWTHREYPALVTL